MNNERRFTSPILTSETHTISVLRDGLAGLMGNASIYLAPGAPGYYVLERSREGQRLYHALKDVSREDGRTTDKHYDIKAISQEQGKENLYFCSCWADMTPSQD
jgi:hypothetical protein